MFYKQIGHSSGTMFLISFGGNCVIACALKVRCHAAQNITAAPQACSAPRCTCTSVAQPAYLSARLDTQHLLHINLH